MELIRKHFSLKNLEKAIALTAAVFGILAFMGVGLDKLTSTTSSLMSASISVPIVGISLFSFAALILMKIKYNEKKARFSNKHEKNAIALSGFSSSLNLSQVDESVCGIYLGIRRVGSNDGVKYFLQFLTISKVSDNDFRFLLFDNYDGKEWNIEGACIKVQTSLILKGAIDCQRDAVHTLYIKCPTHAHSERLEGIISLTRLDVTSAMSTRVAFQKIYDINSVGQLPNALFRSSLLGQEDFKVARVYTETELENQIKQIRFFNENGKISSMKSYIDNEPTDHFIVHS
ncbi:hypothetical protein [Vibrio owensii]|uniref:hypothetical protein n=1 Tax=Vibrio owensii TaxID=696485 RepID=UPI004068A932